MMKLTAFLILIFLSCALSAQENLVRNPSFELYNHLPGFVGDAPGAIQYWSFAGERGSGDYYHTNAPGTAYQTDDNYFGSEEPHMGKAYAGFCVTPEYREFLASELYSTLVKGQKYRFTMFVSKGDNEDVSYLKEISVMFLSRSWVLNDDLQMGLPPQIVFYQDSGFTQTNGWQKLTAIYTARGTEKWIYIGAHQWKCDTCKSVPGAPRTASPGIFGPGKQAHYYVDDVAVIAVNETPAVDTTQFTTGQFYSFHNIHFANNSAVLEKGDQPDLDKILTYLKTNANVTVSVFGYTDDVGSEEDNLRLSLARAEAVKNYLVENGIQASRISAEGYGEFHPVANNNTEEGRALNRRVEFLFEK